MILTGIKKVLDNLQLDHLRDQANTKIEELNSFYKALIEEEKYCEESYQQYELKKNIVDELKAQYYKLHFEVYGWVAYD